MGGFGDDTLVGNAADNTLRGNGGRDTIDGGAGIDRAVFAGLRSAYALTALGGGSVRVVGPDGTDTLTSIERLVFDDQTVVWPPAGSAVRTAPHGLRRRRQGRHPVARQRRAHGAVGDGRRQDPAGRRRLGHQPRRRLEDRGLRRLRRRRQARHPLARQAGTHLHLGDGRRTRSGRASTCRRSARAPAGTPTGSATSTATARPTSCGATRLATRPCGRWTAADQAGGRRLRHQPRRRLGHRAARRLRRGRQERRAVARRRRSTPASGRWTAARSSKGPISA